MICKTTTRERRVQSRREDDPIQRPIVVLKRSICKEWIKEENDIDLIN